MIQAAFTSHDNQKIICSVWDDVAHPIGIVQIVHGMDEDVYRYNNFARFLNKNGYIVCGDDHRGHGRTAKIEDGTYKHKDVFNDTVLDELEILKYLKTKYRLPVYLFGYGYGGFIARKMLAQTKMYSAGVCVTGRARYSRVALMIAKYVAWAGKCLRGARSDAKLIEAWMPVPGIISGPYKTKYNGHEDVKRQIMQHRHKCFSNGFYYSLFKNMLQSDCNKVNETSLLVISNGDDVAAQKGKLGRNLYNAYKTSDLRKLTLIIYTNVKHDLLFDINWENAQNDILDFFRQNASR